MKLVLYTVICFSFLTCNNSPTSNNVALINVDTSQSTNNIAAPTKNINYLADCKNYYAQAKKLDSILLKEIDLNVTLANKAIKAFTDFAYYCQADSLSPMYLVKSAQVAKAINNYPQAKIVLDKCITDYPNFKNKNKLSKKNKKK